jgi:hypothetical protein
MGNMMEALLTRLGDFGVAGLVAAIVIYDVFYLQKKLLTIIENNTKAMTELKNFCSNKKELS